MTQSVYTNCRLAFLTNFIPPYREPVLAALSVYFNDLRVMISTSMEANRPWVPEWKGLDVVLQRTFTIARRSRHPGGFREKSWLHFPLDTVGQLMRFRADVVISAEMGFRTLMATFYRKMRRRSKLIIWVDVAEATEQGRGWVRTVMRRALAKHADLLIVNGQSGARYLAKLGVDESKLFTVPYTADVSHFARNALTNKPKDSRRLLYAGRLTEQKGLVQFVNVLSRWASDNPEYVVDLMFVGGGPLRIALERTRTPGNVKLTVLGSVPYDEMPEVYSQSDILVLSTLADTWGLVVNEGMAAGLPVLGSVYSQAVDELVTDGENGWRFRPDHPDELYIAIDLCMKTPADMLNGMRHSARRTAMGLTPEYVAELIYNAVAVCMKKVPKPRLAILTNLIAPSRKKVYEDIADEFETYVLTGGSEANREMWDGAKSEKFTAKTSWGFTISWFRRQQGRIFDSRYFHVRPGYFVDLLRLRPDVVISSEMGIRSCLAFVYGWLLGKPVWIWWGGTMHTERRRTRFKKIFRAVFTRAVRHWISYGASSTEYLASFGIPSCRILQIQNCTDESRFRISRDTAAGRDDSFRFLFVGRLVAGKGLEQLFAAFSRMRQAGGRASLTLVGAGPERSRLELLARDLGLCDVSFEGAKTPDAVVDFYRNADCLVLPTLEDVWGLVVNEAIWAGVPVLCSKYAGAAPEIVPVENIFDPLDHVGFVRALKSAVERKLTTIRTDQLRTSADIAKQITTALLNEVSTGTRLIAQRT